MRNPTRSILTPLLAATLWLAIATPGQAVQLPDLVYHLHNHPGGFAPGPGYGLRLDELIDVTPQEDNFTFNFDDPRSSMRMRISNNGTRIHIYGRAYGGYLVPNAVPADAVYDDVLSGVFNIDFVYDTGVQNAPGDDDLWVPDSSNMMNFGTLSWNSETWDLKDYAGSNGYTFRLGDEDDDQGHWNYPGISGWGWLLFNSQTQNGNTLVNPNDFIDTLPGKRDWLFTAVPTPEPITAALTTLGVGCLAMGMSRRRMR